MYAPVFTQNKEIIRSLIGGKQKSLTMWFRTQWRIWSRSYTNLIKIGRPPRSKRQKHPAEISTGIVYKQGLQLRCCAENPCLYTIPADFR